MQNVLKLIVFVDHEPLAVYFGYCVHWEGHEEERAKVCGSCAERIK